VLEVTGLDVAYGRVQVLHSISLSVPDGSIVAVLGPNGAGKSTLLKTISGLLRARRGAITFLRRDITRFSVADIMRLGISHVPEGRGMLSEFTVWENLKLASYTRRDREAVRSDLRRVYDLFPVLEERLSQPAGTLSGGEQQMLAIGRALVARPRLLMIDEMSLGLAPLTVLKLFDVLTGINRDGTTVLLVEQNVRMALRVASHAYLLESGRVAIHGPAAELAADPKVEASYLGVDRHASE
jgi:branched-chain amino acid transport system ATP-binding protein